MIAKWVGSIRSRLQSDSRGDMAPLAGAPGFGRPDSSRPSTANPESLANTGMANLLLDWSRTQDCYTFRGNQKLLGNGFCVLSTEYT